MENAMTATRPGEGLKTEKMPGHWVLARMGKRVLRPGGMELTRRMLDALRISESDDVVEFAPGMGVTARVLHGGRARRGRREDRQGLPRRGRAALRLRKRGGDGAARDVGHGRLRR